MDLALLLLAVALVGGVCAVALGRVRGGLEAPTSSLPLQTLPAGSLEPSDVDDVRFALGLRGYRMDQVDAVLERLRGELEQRDEQIAALVATGTTSATAPTPPTPTPTPPPTVPEDPAGPDPAAPDPAAPDPAGPDPAAPDPAAPDPAAPDPGPPDVDEVAEVPPPAADPADASSREDPAEAPAAPAGRHRGRAGTEAVREAVPEAGPDDAWRPRTER